MAEPAAPGVRRLTARNGGPLTFRGTNCYLLGENEITVVDPGPDDVAHIDELMAVADANEIMPPKSTWFEPKLRDGMVIHTLD